MDSKRQLLPSTVPDNGILARQPFAKFGSEDCLPLTLPCLSIWELGVLYSSLFLKKIEPCFSSTRSGGRFSLAIPGLKDQGIGVVAVAATQGSLCIGHGTELKQTEDRVESCSWPHESKVRGKPDCGPRGSKNIAKTGHQARKRKEIRELCQMAKGLWVTEKSSHRGEGNQASDQTNVTCDSEGRELRLPGKPGCGPGRSPGPPSSAREPSLT